MTDDLRALVWLEWKKLRGNVTYWLAIIGFEPGANPFYLVYVALFWASWLYLVWALLVDQVERFSAVLPPSFISGVQEGIPVLVFLTQMVYLAAALRDSPLKLSGPEIEIVASSPVRRGAFMLVSFVRSLFVPACLVAVASGLIAMLLTWPSAPNKVGVAGLQAMILGFTTFWLSTACVWVIAAFKASLSSRAKRLAVWLALPAVLFLALTFPRVMLAPGRLWVTTILTGLTATTLLSVTASVFAACALLVLAGNRIRMTAVTDDSQLYARIQRLGMFGRLYAADVIASVEHQARLARKKRLRLALPAQASGYSAVRNRALLSLFRLAPSSLLNLVMRGIVFAGLVALVARMSTGQQLQAWILLMMFVIQFRPTELNRLFRQDAGQSFTRQFLPKNPLKLVLADSAFPVFVFSAGGLAALLLQPLSDPLSTALLVVSFAATLAFCQALELVTLPRLFLRHVPYAYLVVACGLVLIVGGYVFQNPFGIALVAFVLNILLAGMLAVSRFDL